MKTLLVIAVICAVAIARQAEYDSPENVWDSPDEMLAEKSRPHHGSHAPWTHRPTRPPNPRNQAPRIKGKTKTSMGMRKANSERPVTPRQPTYGRAQFPQTHLGIRKGKGRSRRSRRRRSRRRRSRRRRSRRRRRRRRRTSSCHALHHIHNGWKVALKGGKDGKYCADEHPHGEVKCNRDAVGGWEKFTVHHAGGGKIALKGGRGGRWCADEGNRIVCNRGHIHGWEKFSVLPLGGGRVALKGGRGHRWCADEGNTVKCNRGGIGGWEKFQVCLQSRL